MGGILIKWNCGRFSRIFALCFCVFCDIIKTIEKSEFNEDNINKVLDINNIYRYLKAIINFLDSSDSMLDAIADYQNEIKAEYEAEMRSNMEWY